ncbi:MAG: hypothetical protein KBD94_03785 [Pyrinomonadaceae bacterium]|nr:hypothetical protein [Pyrinomonadaceae bacterium]
MKTIFRYANMGLLVAVLFALGAAAGAAQDNCADDEATATARNAAGDKVRADFGTYGKASLDEKGRTIDNAKAFLDKYQACSSTQDLVDYLKQYLPGMETALRDARVKKAKDELIKRFDDSLRMKNWDESFASGKEILAKYPDEFRTVEIVLASIAGEEAFKSNFKYMDDGLRFAKQSISDLETGKSFVLGNVTRYGLSLKESGKVIYNFEYSNKNKDDALGWLNLYIGYMMAVGQKNTVAALPYLYKSTQLTASEASRNSVSYDLIGSYYFAELDKLIEQINVLRPQQDKPGITEDEIKRLVEEIKAKVAMSNGTAERAIDAFARAQNLAKDLAIKARLKTNVEKAYNVRFGKKEGVDVWVATAVARPFVNPQTPITPVSDPDPTTTSPAATTTTTTTTTTTVTTSVPVPTKPVTAPATKPASKATSGVKPQAKAKKPVRRKVA